MQKLLATSVVLLSLATGCNPPPEDLNQPSSLSGGTINTQPTTEIPGPAVVEIPKPAVTKQVDIPEGTKLTQKTLEGSWRMISLTNTPEEYVTTSEIIFEVSQGAYRFLLDDFEMHSGRLQLETAAIPVQLDMHVLVGDNQGGITRSVARFHNGKLELCQGDTDQDRPTSFFPAPGTGISLAIFEKIEREEEKVEKE